LRQPLKRATVWGVPKNPFSNEGQKVAKDKSPKTKEDVEDIIDAEEVHEEELLDEMSSDAANETEEPSPDVGDEQGSESVLDEPADFTPDVAAEPQKRPSVFMPMLFGGLVAGGIGFGAGTYMNSQASQDLTLQVEDLEQRMSDLTQQIASAPTIDLAALNERLAAQGEGIADLGVSVSTGLSSLSDRLDIVERQPSGDGSLQESAIAAYDRDIQALRDQLADQQAEMQAMMDTARQQLEQTQQEAQAIEDQTVAAAKAATARSALARIQASLESGGPFGAILAELEAVSDDPLPDALVAVQDGAPTLAMLVDEFPDAARAALTTARAEGASGEETSGFSAFLRNQFSVRSVEPQEGSSVDAILSRAQAALSEGRLNDTLAEVASLPEVARADLSAWTAKAELRASALDAASTLFLSYNTN